MNCKYLFSKEASFPENITEAQKAYIYQFQSITQTAIINRIPDRYLHHINIEEEESLHLIIESMKSKTIPSINRQKEELEQEAAQLGFPRGENLVDFFQR